MSEVALGPFDCVVPVPFKGIVSQIDEELAQLHCPVCGNENTHLNKLSVFLGDTVITIGPAAELSISPLKPHERRGWLIWAYGTCEESCAFVYSAQFHKGQISLGLTADKGALLQDGGFLSDVPELWRD